MVMGYSLTWKVLVMGRKSEEFSVTGKCVECMTLVL